MVRENEDTGKTPVVLLTLSREEQDEENGYRLSVNAYGVKPVEFREFAQAIQDLGVFGGGLNEPPPGSLRVHRNG